MEREDKGQWVRRGGISGKAHWRCWIVMRVTGGGGCAVLPGSVERGRRMSLRSVESVMTSSKAVTSDGDGVWGQKRGGRHEA